MTANSVIVTANQQYFSNFQLSSNGELLTPVDYQSDNSSSLSYTDISYSVGMDSSSPSAYSTSDTPYLTIVEEPKELLRFRYKSEKGCHGGLKPVVKLHNCDSPDRIWVKATLYTCGESPVLHVLELQGKQSKSGPCWQKLSNDFTAKFSGLSIIMKKREEVLSILKERTKQEYRKQNKRINEQEIEREVQEKIKTFNLNCGQLCFEAFYEKDESFPVCEVPVYSQPIFHQKNTLTEELKITRLSSYSGKTSGNEDVILLCEKIKKDDIEVIFFCQDINWEERAQFNPTDVHHQVAIPFKTPRFIQNIEKEVFIKLQRRSDGKSGEPRPFLYKPCDDFDGKPSKRKRSNSSENISISTIQYEPCTSTTPEINLPDIDLSNLEFPDVLLSDFLENADFDLPFEKLEPVNTEGIHKLAALSLSQKPLKKRIVGQEWAEVHASKKEVDEIQMLKSGIISLLNEQDGRVFLKFLPTLMHVRDENRNSLLHLAVSEKGDNLPMIIKMVKAASDGIINETNKAQTTPLHIAVSKSLWKITRILLMSGADPNIRDKNGNTCIHLAAYYGFPWCLAEILANLLSNVKRKHFPAINTLNYDGLAPLHLCVINNSKSCVQLLIKAKANINIQDGKSGKTPLHYAYEKGFSELVNLLLAQPDADQNAEGFNGCAPNTTKKNQNSPVSKPTECCIELSTESSSSNEDEFITIKEEKSSISEEENIKSKLTEENGDSSFCTALDSNGLWKKLGKYVLEDEELNVIAIMDTTPTKTVLNELKKRHGEKYPEKLMNILTKDSELKEFSHLLKI